MATLLFLLVHVITLLLFTPLLILTIPLHLIFVAVNRPRHATPFIPGPGDLAPGGVPYVQCPDCRELIRADARKCKHCGSDLTPTV